MNVVEIEVSDESALNEGAPCLHCVLTEVVQEYWRTFGKRDEAGQIAFDVPLTVAKIAEVMANVLVRVGTPADQEKLIADAHAVLDGIIHTIRTGQPFEYQVGGPAKVH